MFCTNLFCWAFLIWRVLGAWNAERKRRKAWSEPTVIRRFPLHRDARRCSGELEGSFTMKSMKDMKG